MPRDVDRASLYRAPINLWVEDEITKAYLDELWGDTGFVCLVGGGHVGVTAMLKDAEQSGYTCIFGVVDRDFRRSNQSNWQHPNKTFREFVLPVHEIENYLLDAQALANCRMNTVGKSEQEIESLLKKEAERHRACEACRRVVSVLRRLFQGRFLKDPRSPHVQDLDAAIKFICDDPWFKIIPRRVGRFDEARIERMVSCAFEKSAKKLGTGKWKEDFPGKEIFHHISSMIFRPIKTYQPTSAELHADLAKEIGAWQRDNDRVPPSLLDLRDALRRRVNPASAAATGGSPE